MASGNYIYQDRVVVFLDVLGFQQQLITFEKEAVENVASGKEEQYTSAAVNNFISTFLEIVALLDPDNYRSYLFSDNICITLDYVENHDKLVEILITVSDLFLRFARKGYFIRGALDVGKFIDERAIAVGRPLATAYKLESQVAVHPRIVLSKDFRTLLDACVQNDSISEQSKIQKELLVCQHCEVSYLNPFVTLVNTQDKQEVLSDIRASIMENLKASQQIERIAVKYEWLADEFNLFLQDYEKRLHFLESEEVTTEELEGILNLLIVDYGF